MLPLLFFEWRHALPLCIFLIYLFFTILLLSGNQNFNPELFNMLAKLENNKLFEVC